MEIVGAIIDANEDSGRKVQDKMIAFVTPPSAVKNGAGNIND